MLVGFASLLCDQASEKTQLPEAAVNALQDKLTNDDIDYVRRECATALGKAHLLSFDAMCAHVEFERKSCA